MVWVLVVLLLLVPLPSFGYVIDHDLDPHFRMTFVLNLSDTPMNTAYGFLSPNDIAETAFAEWNRVGIGQDQDHEFFRVIRSTSHPTCISDGINVVSFSSGKCRGVSWGDAVGAARHHINFEDWDILLNVNRQWGAFPGPLTTDLRDLYRTILHEIGHTIGLDHPNEFFRQREMGVVALMNAGGTATLDRLQPDDIDGAHALPYSGPFMEHFQGGSLPVHHFTQPPPVVVTTPPPPVAQTPPTTPPPVLSPSRTGEPTSFPHIAFFNIDPKQIDTTNGPQTVNVYIRVQDPFNGVDNSASTVFFEHTSVEGHFAQAFPPFPVLQHDPLFTDVLFEIPVTFQASSSPGTYNAFIQFWSADSLDVVQLSERLGEFTQLGLPGSVTVISRTPTSPMPTPAPIPTPAPVPSPSPTPITPEDAPIEEDLDGPDLVPRSVKISHNTKRLDGDKLRVQIDIDNQGKPVDQRFFISWWWKQHLDDDDMEFLFTTIVQEAIGRNDSLRITMKKDQIMPRLTGGYLIAHVDSAEEVLESNERNNYLIYGLGTVCDKISSECVTLR